MEPLNIIYSIPTVKECSIPTVKIPNIQFEHHLKNRNTEICKSIYKNRRHTQNKLVLGKDIFFKGKKRKSETKYSEKSDQCSSLEDLKQSEPPLHSHSCYKQGYMSLRKRSQSESKALQCDTIDQCNSLSSEREDNEVVKDMVKLNLKNKFK